MEEIRLTEEYITNAIKEFLVMKENGNWHENKIKMAKLREHGADLILKGGSKNSETFIIEVKGRYYSKTADKSANKEVWLTALGQLITRMDTERVIKSGTSKGRINTAYKYGLGLYWVAAKVALRRIPKTIAKTLNLYIFSVSDEGKVKQFSPKDFSKDYDEEFFK